MAWNLSAYLRSTWLRGWNRRRPKTVLHGQLYLERFEEHNPPSSLLVGALAGAAAGSLLAGNASNQHPPITTAGTAPTTTPTNVTAAAGTTGSGASTGNNGAAAGGNVTASSAAVDPFTDPFADPIDSTASKPSGGGGSGSGNSAGSSGGNNVPSGGSGASYAAFVSGSAVGAAGNNDLWSSANTLTSGGTAASVTNAPAPNTSVTTSGQMTTAPTTKPIVPALGPKYQTPLSFAANVGQTDPSVHFLSQNAGFSVFLTDSGATFEFAQPGQPGNAQVLQLQLDGANAHPTIVTGAELPNRANYFTNGQSFTNVAQFTSVTYEDAYPGISIVFSSNAQNQFEYTVQASPGADLSQMKLTWQGAQGLSTDAHGNLDIQTATGTLVENAPSLYQTNGSATQTVAGSQVLLGNNQIGFTASGYDPTKALVVDPTLGFSTYVGGSGDDSAFAIAVNPDGTAVIAGSTASSTFPNSPGLIQGTYGGSTDAFVSKFSPTGQLIYSSFLGGSAADAANGVALDATGDAYVIGTTSSSGYPTTSGAARTTYGSGSSDGFVTKIDATGDALVYSTFVGISSDTNVGNAIMVNAMGVATLTGTTTGYYGSGLQAIYVQQLTASGSAFNFTTIVGSAYGNSTGNAVAVDPTAGNIYVAGSTSDSSFPLTTGHYQASLAGSSSAVIAELTSTGSDAAATYYGGSGSETASGIAFLPGMVAIAGNTNSTNLPTTAGAPQTSSGGGMDAFVAVFAPSLNTLQEGTYLGGSGTDVARHRRPGHFFRQLPHLDGVHHVREFSDRRGPLRQQRRRHGCLRF